jgi:hypothetical protein
MENWKKFTISEKHRQDIIDIAKGDGGSETEPTPFIGHNYRTKYEIDDGTIELSDISDNGIMFFLITPFDMKRYQKAVNDKALGEPISGVDEPGKYELAVQFVHWNDTLKSNLDTRQKTYILMKNDNRHNNTDDLKIHCTCPSFRFHYHDVADKDHNVAISNSPGPPGSPNDKHPPVNPARTGITCKHSRRIMQVMTAYFLDLERKIADLTSGQ